MRLAFSQISLGLIVFFLTNAVFEPSRVQAEDYAIRFFLENEPREIDSLSCPRSILAEVRIVSGPIYLIGRDHSGRPPVMPKDLFWVRARISKVIAKPSQFAVGDSIELHFGVPGVAHRIIYPKTPSQLDREYFVLICRQEGRHGLVPFPASKREYEVWYSETR